MDDRKELHSRRRLTTGRPVPPDFAAHCVNAVSRRTLAKQYSVDPRTIIRWMNEPELLREVAELRAEIRAAARAKCLQLTPFAVDTLKDVMEGDHPMARVKAAEATLRIGGVGPAEDPGTPFVEGSLEEQARMVLAVAETLLRDMGDVETAAKVAAARDRIVPDAELNIITDGAEVGDE